MKSNMGMPNFSNSSTDTNSNVTNTIYMDNMTPSMSLNPSMQNINSMALSDKDIASDMLKDSKFGLSGLTMALAESTNPQVRQLLTEQFNNCLTGHHRLSDMAISKNWYPAFEQPMKQLQTGLQETQNI